MFRTNSSFRLDSAIVMVMGFWFWTDGCRGLVFFRQLGCDVFGELKTRDWRVCWRDALLCLRFDWLNP